MTYKKDKRMYSQEELLKIQEESQKQALPEQKRVFSVSDKIRRRVHNLPDYNVSDSVYPTQSEV